MPDADGLKAKALYPRWEKLVQLGSVTAEAGYRFTYGGDLYQDIKPFEHLPHNDHWAKVHTVTVRRGTLLSRILGQDTVLVNSQHHQAVDRVAPGFTLAALSEDGIVEAIEKPDARFCLGVQWHPEWLSDADPAMQGLFDAFVNACSK